MYSTLINNQKEFKFKKGDSTTMVEFDKLYKELFNRTWIVGGREYNLNDLGWVRGYNTRKSALGICEYGKYNKLIKKVFISKTLLNKNLDKPLDFEDTIRHEFAHAIDVEMRGHSNHDYHWQSICRAVGADDSRLHEGFLVKPKGKYSATCVKCGNDYQKYRKPTRQSSCKCIGGFNADYALDWKQNY